MDWGGEGVRLSVGWQQKFIWLTAILITISPVLFAGRLLVKSPVGPKIVSKSVSDLANMLFQ